jgi:hypothetical protein
VLRGLGVGAATTIEAVTLTRGSVSGDCPDPDTGAYCMGGGVLLVESAPAFVRCRFVENHAEDNGGGLASVASAPTLAGCRFEANDARHGGAITFVASTLGGAAPVVQECVFVANVALADAGAVYAYVSRPAITRCTFHANRSGEQASSIFWYDAAPPAVDRCIFAFGEGGEAIHSGVAGTAPVLSCCDVFGNEGGDWVGCLAGQDLVGDNLAADPLFCDPAALDVTLRAASPCAPPAAGCGLVGAAAASCAALPAGSPAATASWGRVKALHRTGR